MQQLTLDTMPGWYFNGAGAADRSVDVDLCELLNSLKVSPDKVPANTNLDTQMSEEPSLPTCIPTSCSTHHPSLSDDEDEGALGCAYLQAIRAQIDLFGTKDGEYLQTIFTHREIASAYPPAHERCARTFSDIAYMMEKRAWGANMHPDVEAVTAFRLEAWRVAASM